MKFPACAACAAVGLRPSRMAPKVDGRLKVVRVKRGGRMVSLPAAFVRCQRRVPVPFPFGAAGCGWGWWTVHPDMVRRAERHPSRRLLRRHQKPAGHPGRRGKGIGRHG